MAKRILQGRTKTKNKIGKIVGRSYGKMVYNDIVNCLVTQKIDKAIKYNKEK